VWHYVEIETQRQRYDENKEKESSRKKTHDSRAGASVQPAMEGGSDVGGVTGHGLAEASQNAIEQVFATLNNPPLDLTNDKTMKDTISNIKKEMKKIDGNKALTTPQIRHYLNNR
jgi:hypothetical protein